MFPATGVDGAASGSGSVIPRLQSALLSASRATILRRSATSHQCSMPSYGPDMSRRTDLNPDRSDARPTATLRERAGAERIDRARSGRGVRALSETSGL
jgi:hypothetical protein